LIASLPQKRGFIAAPRNLEGHLIMGNRNFSAKLRGCLGDKKRASSFYMGGERMHGVYSFAYIDAEVGTFL